MSIREMVQIGTKTTMRIGGSAKYYAEITTKEEAEEAVAFARDRGIPLIVLGSGANTIFADSVIDALVVRLKNDKVQIDGNTVTIGTGKNLAMLINELAEQNLDLSALTGIPGTVGGSIFGNAGQGPKGIWIDSFVKNVTAYMDGEWKTLDRESCHFRYRESGFKDASGPVIIWETVLEIPTRPAAEVKEEVEALLKKRIETQPHLKTAGSCFKALPDGTPAWKLIDAAALRGHTIGGIQISEKHANFLLNVGGATFDDALQMTNLIRTKIPQIASIEMRLYGTDGKLAA